MRKVMTGKTEQFLLYSVAVWFGVISLALLARLWYGPVMIHESNRVVLAMETLLAFAIIFAALCGFTRMVLSLRRAGKQGYVGDKAGLPVLRTDSREG
jgi:hypothetical protein